MTFIKLAIPVGITVAIGLMVASCAPQYSSPQQVQSTVPSNPTVTYKYMGDQDLVQANQNAAVFCNQYQSVPRTKTFSTEPDGGKLVVFECLQTAHPQILPPQYNPNISYNYMTDQELVDASRNAQIYCMNNGSQQVISNVITNTNGSRTVSFQCAPR
jgi:hypothetical protein